MAHVRSEMRRVYHGGKKHKLTRHAAYVAAAKQLIADRCASLDDARYNEWRDGPDYQLGISCPEPCSKDGAYQCRFHTFTPPDAEDENERCGMLHYRRVKARLVRFLKFIDAREQRS